MELNINVVHEKEKVIVSVSREIDAYTAPKFKETLLPLTNDQGNDIEVNLKDVEYMDSTGLGVFISALKSTNEHQSQLKLVQLQSRVMRVFEITGLDQIMDIHADSGGINDGSI